LRVSSENQRDLRAKKLIANGEADNTYHAGSGTGVQRTAYVLPLVSIAYPIIEPLSAVPLATFAHVPAPLMLHDWQPAQPLVVQQTPSMQKPVPHSLPPMQGAPGTFFATQLPGVVALPVQ
jgi:hypothetical protein